MTNIAVFPIIIPLIIAIILLIVPNKPMIKRMISSVSSLFLIAITIWLCYTVFHDGTQTMASSGWVGPFGIVVVADMLSALLVLTSSIITFFTIVYSFQSIGKAREEHYYYASIFFMICGVHGAFLTGDIFNMFVFFEVFLLSSYVLLTLGGTKVQLQESIKYILINIISSGFFVMGMGMLYSVVGSLNMADIHMKLSTLDEPLPIISIISVMFLFVFATKAGLFPLYFWLPGTYYAPPIPIIALFGALLTKVGVYAIMRTYSLIFFQDPTFTHNILLFFALVTIIFGSIGAISYKDMKKIIIYNIMIAIGVILVGVSMMNVSGIMGAIYYLIHDMFIKAALFLLVGIIISITGYVNINRFGGLIKYFPVLGWIFFIAALSLIGIPPLSGFYGKFLIAQSTFQNGHYIAGVIVLLSSLFVLSSIIRVFMKTFWGKEVNPLPAGGGDHIDKLKFSAYSLVIISVLFGLFANSLYPVIEKAQDSFTNPTSYTEYLGGDSHGNTDSH